MKYYVPIILTLIFVVLTAILLVLFVNIKRNSGTLSTNNSPANLVEEQTNVIEENNNVKMQESINKTGSLSGKICYPSESIPPLSITIQNVESKEILSLESKVNQASYFMEKIPVGSYIAYASVKDINNNVGGYSQAVPCGLSVDCKDHSLIEFNIDENDETKNIDICDWYGVKIENTSQVEDEKTEDPIEE